MVSLKKKQALIKKLKTPERFFKIDFGRYGGEVAMGSITKEQYEYWADKDQSDFEEYMTNIGWGDEETNKDVPKQAQFDQEFYEYNDICHLSGPEFADSQYMTISEVDKEGNALTDENGNYIEDETVNMEDFEDRGAKITCEAEHNSGTQSCKDNYYMFGQYFNKGGWHTPDIVKTGPDGFDFKKLEIAYEDCDGFKVFNEFLYNGDSYHLEEDSTGKSSSFYVAEGDDV
jgi:hypothetical protein